jgi:hypothetical protein
MSNGVLYVATPMCESLYADYITCTKLVQLVYNKDNEELLTPCHFPYNHYGNVLLNRNNIESIFSPSAELLQAYNSLLDTLNGEFSGDL